MVDNGALCLSTRGLRYYFVKELDAFGEGFNANPLVVAVEPATQFARRSEKWREAITDDPQFAEVMAISKSSEHRLRQNRVGIMLLGDGGDSFIERRACGRRVGFKGEERLDLDTLVFNDFFQLVHPAVNFFAGHDTRINV